LVKVFRHYEDVVEDLVAGEDSPVHMNEGDDSSKSPGLVLGMPPSSSKVPESKKELVKKTRIIE